MIRNNMSSTIIIQLLKQRNRPPVSHIADKGIKYHRGNRESDGTENVSKIICSAYCPKNDPEYKHSNADNAKDQDSSLLFLKKVPDQIYGTAH